MSTGSGSAIMVDVLEHSSLDTVRQLAMEHAVHSMLLLLQDTRPAQNMMPCGRFVWCAVKSPMCCASSMQGVHTFSEGSSGLANQWGAARTCQIQGCDTKVGRLQGICYCNCTPAAYIVICIAAVQVAVLS